MKYQSRRRRYTSQHREACHEPPSFAQTPFRVHVRAAVRGGLGAMADREDARHPAHVGREAESGRTCAPDIRRQARPVRSLADGDRYHSDFKSADAQPWARERTRQREATPTSDSWSTLCLPPGPMITFSGPLKIVQTPRLVTVLYEVPNNFRQIFMDGRSLPKDPSPTWQGYSVGRWDGDALDRRDHRVQRRIVCRPSLDSSHRSPAHYRTLSTP